MALAPRGMPLAAAVGKQELPGEAEAKPRVVVVVVVAVAVAARQEVIERAAKPEIAVTGRSITRSSRKRIACACSDAHSCL